MNLRYSTIVLLVLLYCCKSLKNGEQEILVIHESCDIQFNLKPDHKYTVIKEMEMSYQSHSDQVFGREQSLSNKGGMARKEFSRIETRSNEDDEIEVVHFIDSTIVDLLQGTKLDTTIKVSKGRIENNRIVLTVSTYVQDDNLEYKSGFLDWNLQGDFPNGSMSIGDTFTYLPSKSDLKMFDEKNKHLEINYILEEIQKDKAIFRIHKMGYDSIKGKNGMIRNLTGIGSACYNMEDQYYEYHTISETENVVMYRDTLAPIFEKIVTKNELVISLVDD